jgi:hypothetical protein
MKDVNVFNNNTLTDEVKINLNILSTVMIDEIGGGGTTTGGNKTLVLVLHQPLARQGPTSTLVPLNPT